MSWSRPRQRAVGLLSLGNLVMCLREEVEPVGSLSRLLLLLLLELLAETGVGPRAAWQWRASGRTSARPSVE